MPEENILVRRLWSNRWRSVRRAVSDEYEYLKRNSILLIVPTMYEAFKPR